MLALFRNQSTTGETHSPPANSFFASLASSRNQAQTQTPLQSFRLQLKQLEKLAKSGDIAGWNQGLSSLSTYAQAAKISLEEDWTVRGSIYNWELTLLLVAGRRAQEQSAQFRAQAGEIRAHDPQGAQALMDRAGRFDALAMKLQAQLRQKTSAPIFGMEE